MFQLPDPLHPAIVHLPLALAVLVPGVALLGALAIQWGRVPRLSWAAVVVAQALLVGSAWLALETGEAQEERVEKVVAERHIEAHEELAERFLAAGGVALVLAAAGLLPGRAGRVGRVAAVLATLVTLGAAVQVGHSGGQLVYRYGAGQAYVEVPAVAGSRAAPVRSRGDAGAD